MVAVISASELFLEIARGLLGPLLGSRHLLIENLLREDSWEAPVAGDIVFCDTIAYDLLHTKVKSRRAVPYRVISPECVDQIASAMAKPSG